MKNRNLKSIISAVALTLALVGCGEQFQATYRGTGTVTSPCYTPNNPYNVEVKTQINGDSVDIYVSQLVSQTQPNGFDRNAVVLTSGTKVTAALGSNNQYSVNRQQLNSNVDFVSSSAFVSNDRAEMTGFSIYRDTVLNDNVQKCTIGLEVSKLTKVQ